MKDPIIIYGTGMIGEVAKYYFDEDSPYRVVAFANKLEFIKEDSFCGLPVIDCEDKSSLKGLKTNKCFVAVGYKANNSIRKSRCEEFENRGFELVSYISSRAIIFSKAIGKSVFILENNVIQPYVSIGDNCILWSGNHVGHHSQVGPNNFLSSHVVISGNCRIMENCFFGVNSTVFDGVTIGKDSTIGAGALVRRDLPQGSKVRPPLSEVQTV